MLDIKSMTDSQLKQLMNYTGTEHEAELAAKELQRRREHKQMDKSVLRLDRAPAKPGDKVNGIRI